MRLDPAEREAATVGRARNPRSPAAGAAISTEVPRAVARLEGSVTAATAAVSSRRRQSPRGALSGSFCGDCGADGGIEPAVSFLPQGDNDALGVQATADAGLPDLAHPPACINHSRVDGHGRDPPAGPGRGTGSDRLHLLCPVGRGRSLDRGTTSPHGIRRSGSNGWKRPCQFLQHGWTALHRPEPRHNAHSGVLLPIRSIRERKQHRRQIQS
jgi:hypothetical protein